MYTENIITSKKYFKMAAKSGFPFVVDYPVEGLMWLEPLELRCEGGCAELFVVGPSSSITIR